LNVYKTFCDGAKGVNFTVPADVMRRTEDFLDAQNIFGSIFGEFYEKVEDKKQTVSVSEIWNWVSTSDSYKNLHYKEKRTYNRKYFDEWLEKRVGKDFDVYLSGSKSKYIKGYKFIDNTTAIINNSLLGIAEDEEEFKDEETGEVIKNY
jgi:preprotein translocase subunit Sec63